MLAVARSGKSGGEKNLSEVDNDSGCVERRHSVGAFCLLTDD